MLYFFHLGRNPTLSIAEIWVHVNQSRIITDKSRIISVSSEVLLLETENKLDAESLLNELGGTIKIGEITDDPYASFSELNAENLAKMILSRLDGKKKLYFGLSLYKLEELSDFAFQKYFKQAKKLGMETKKILSARGVNCRFVVSQERILSSVVVEKNNLLPPHNGLEIAVFIGRNRVYPGRTLAAQKFQAYGLADYGRPRRDITSGMLPPKLAKIMINLAGIDKNQILLDPFCGSGTVLQQAILMGYQNVIGSDISEKAVQDSQENLDWIAERIKDQGSRTKDFKIFTADARRLSEKLEPKSVDAIITEPYLGPPLKGNESSGKIEKIIRGLSEIYLAAFGEFWKVLNKGGRVVIVFPVFKTSFRARGIGDKRQETGAIYLPILEEIKKMGFEMKNLIPGGLPPNSVIQTTPRGSIFYSRPGQKVLREIIILMKNGE